MQANIVLGPLLLFWHCECSGKCKLMLCDGLPATRLLSLSDKAHCNLLIKLAMNII